MNSTDAADVVALHITAAINKYDVAEHVSALFHNIQHGRSCGVET